MTVWEFLAALALALAGGAVGAAIVNGVNERSMHKMKRKFEKEDKSEDVEKRLSAIEQQMSEQSTMLVAVAEADKYLLYDRIRHIGEGYISEGEVDFDDRRMLNAMHYSYHNGLGGNGDLDKLMEAVNQLPLKVR